MFFSYTRLARMRHTQGCLDYQGHVIDSCLESYTIYELFCLQTLKSNLTSSYLESFEHVLFYKTKCSSKTLLVILLIIIINVASHCHHYHQQQQQQQRRQLQKMPSSLTATCHPARLQISLVSSWKQTHSLKPELSEHNGYVLLFLSKTSQQEGKKKDVHRRKLPWVGERCLCF